MIMIKIILSTLSSLILDIKHWRVLIPVGELAPSSQYSYHSGNLIHLCISCYLHYHRFSIALILRNLLLSLSRAEQQSLARIQIVVSVLGFPDAVVSFVGLSKIEMRFCHLGHHTIKCNIPVMHLQFLLSYTNGCKFQPSILSNTKEIVC